MTCFCVASQSHIEGVLMKDRVPAISALTVGAAALALLSVPVTEFAPTVEGAGERPASSAVDHTVFHAALASGTTVGTLDYDDPGANCRNDPSC
jgi:hypothetical protein